ncbi:hypothetical protein GBA52_003749 [Prunus armeniaca]|nr:hypothetical protein GBA52_003749 [Prunus armeniaca]
MGIGLNRFSQPMWLGAPVFQSRYPPLIKQSTHILKLLRANGISTPDRKTKIYLACSNQFIGCEFWASKINNRKCLAVDSDEGARAVESSSSQALVLYEADSILEPYEGMEFESEDAAKIFYDEYARRVGFVMRVMSCRRSERDGRILARRLGCNKEGHCDHNHPLVVSPREARQTMDEKDKKIQELTAELRNKKRLCTTYQEQLTAFTKIVEEYSDQLSKKVQNVVSNLKEFESIDRELSQHR